MSDLPTAADRCQGCNEPIGKRHVSGCVYDVTTADSEREDEAENEKTPEGAYSYVEVHSFGLNTSIIADTLKDYALKLVANAHSEMSEEQWDDWLNEHTEAYTEAIDAYLDRRLDAAVSGLPEKQDPVHEALKFDTGYKMGWNEALDAAKQSILSQKSGNGSGKAGGEV